MHMHEENSALASLLASDEMVGDSFNPLAIGYLLELWSTGRVLHSENRKDQAN